MQYKSIKVGVEYRAATRNFMSQDRVYGTARVKVVDKPDPEVVAAEAKAADTEAYETALAQWEKRRTEVKAESPERAARMQSPIRYAFGRNHSRVYDMLKLGKPIRVEVLESGSSPGSYWEVGNTIVVPAKFLLGTVEEFDARKVRQAEAAKQSRIAKEKAQQKAAATNERLAAIAEALEEAGIKVYHDSGRPHAGIGGHLSVRVDAAEKLAEKLGL